MVCIFAKRFEVSRISQTFRAHEKLQRYQTLRVSISVSSTFALAVHAMTHVECATILLSERVQERQNSDLVTPPSRCSFVTSHFLGVHKTLCLPAFISLLPSSSNLKGSEPKFSVKVVPKLIIFVHSLVMHCLGGGNMLNMNIISVQVCFFINLLISVWPSFRYSSTVSLSPQCIAFAHVKYASMTPAISGIVPHKNEVERDYFINRHFSDLAELRDFTRLPFSP